MRNLKTYGLFNSELKEQSLIILKKLPMLPFTYEENENKLYNI